jgi:nucleolar MIF4G domain-containing protein 1
MLKPHTRTFLRELFIQLFIYTQSPTPLVTHLPPAPWDRKPLEEVFIKAVKVEALSMGLVYCISDLIMKGERKEEKLIKWACNIATETLRMGVDVVLNI